MNWFLYDRVHRHERVNFKTNQTQWTHFAKKTCHYYTTWKMANYGVFCGPYFPVFRLNTEIYGVNLRIWSKWRECGPEKTPYLDTFHAVLLSFLYSFNWQFSLGFSMEKIVPGDKCKLMFGLVFSCSVS